ncbi:unnamed protein product [Lactuca saligna]|uniref:PAP/OAS1 substrate-binding-related domain-containing protein n=1 Tax=Lactuca saligna TaxID=75948 RepID=A0AA35YP84_LACSI|nr:unnamed protein product [Lactuca saligna]
MIVLSATCYKLCDNLLACYTFLLLATCFLFFFLLAFLLSCLPNLANIQQLSAVASFFSTCLLSSGSHYHSQTVNTTPCSQGLLLLSLHRLSNLQLQPALIPNVGSGPVSHNKNRVLYRFLEFVSNFDWENFCVNLWGPVPVSSLPDVTAEPPRKDSGELLLNKVFLDACSSLYAVFPGGQNNQGQTFVSKHFNVIDPLRVSNNLGCSVSKGIPVSCLLMLLLIVRLGSEGRAIYNNKNQFFRLVERELQPWIAKDDDVGEEMWRVNQRIVRAILHAGGAGRTSYKHLHPVVSIQTRLTAMVARNEFRRRRRSTAATIVVNSSRRYRVCVLVLATVVDSGTS